MLTRSYHITVLERAERDPAFATALVDDITRNPHLGSTLDAFIATLPPEQQRAIHERAQRLAQRYHTAWHNRHIMRRKIRRLTA